MKYQLIKPVVVVILLGASGSTSFWLRDYAELSESSLMVLLTMSFILSILLPHLNQLKSFSIVKGEMILSEVEEKEKNIKKVALATAKVARVIEKEALILSPDGSPSEIIAAIEDLEKIAS